MLTNFKRHLSSCLDDWKQNEQRKPLILRGARQVGKTTLVRQFSQKYKHSILLNLEKESDKRWLEEFDDVKIIVEALLVKHNISSNDLHKTLLFLDEIQESPKAIQLLRYFYEEIPELHIIAAGSLLEFAMRKVKSFPVGRVEYLNLNPLNFLEYLVAINHQAALDQINEIPVNNFAHKTLLDLFNHYAIIGGMPEVIQTYILKKSITDLPRVYESIWGTYQDDVVKYTSNDTERKIIKHIISTAHLYIDQRIKFHNFGNSNYRSREVGEAMRNLDDASIIQLIYPSTDLQPPLKPDIKKSPRLQFLDTGIVNYSLNIQADMLGISDLSSTYKGSIIPHIVYQELMSLNTTNQNKPPFWVREKKQSSAEVDIIITHNNKAIPVEIKSGSTGRLRSLHQFIDLCSHSYAIRIYAGEYKVEMSKTQAGKPFLIMNLPYYLGTKIPEYIDYFLSNYKL
jgi:predicted AAA+ superfamily ATPase